ncbi:uncharacterized protein LOC132561023 [Ylistrum balloti]|uniref:uncharacterized protein LOC132561023 n=1 Tax=Ylistrum balloti TaxID=509963 RepID=UPI002905B9DA|nr:uncharacterized protein LOC132561023 [Ylistrum balloti]
MAIVKKFKTSKCFARDSERLVSQTLLEACRIEGSIKIVQELAICEADLSFCKACRPGSEAQHISPLECAADANDHETVHFLLESGATIPHSKWRFWDFVKVAAEKQDTFLCNIMFIKSLSMFCRNKPISVNSALEKFTEKALKLNPESESDRKQFFFDCLILIGINPDLYSAFTTTFFHGERLPKGDRGENPCHMVLESSLNHEREFRTLGTLANEEFEMLNEKDNSGHTPLAKAVILGKSNDILSQMLLQIANADLKDSSGRTALHLAITSPNEDRWVLKFVNALASPNITCEDIMTAIPIQLCISKGRHRKETLRRLLAVNEKENKLPLSLLHHCINSTIPVEEMLDVMSVLKEFGADLNTDDDCNCKPIATATKRLYMNVMDTLMSWNAAIEDIDGQKNTILHYCCYVDAEKGNTILDAYNKYHSQNVTAINKQNDSGKTALMAYLSESAIRFDTKIIWRLLNLEPDLSIQDAEGDTVLHYLMQSTLADGDVLNFTQVMVNDFCLSVSVCNARDLSPLMCALTAKKSRFETVKFILSLQDGVKPRCPLLPEEMGILHHCINSCMSDDEVHEISHMLIEQWGISANKPDTTGVSPLSASIKHSLSRRKTIVLILKHSERELCTSILSDLIKHDKLDADIVDAMHKENIPIFKTRNQIDHSVFHYLINNARHFPTFQDLLVSFLPFGHDINHVDSEGFSPLYRACRDNCPEPIVSSLLSNGANVHLTSREESALHLCVQSKRNDADTRTIALAILGSSDININARDSYYETAVASAVRRGKVLTVKTLLEHGADPNIPDRENKTTLHHCVEGLWSDQNTCEFLHLLLPKVHIDQTDGNKCSALNVAASHSSFSRIFSILTLITAGSNIKTVDRQGRSPLHNTVKCLTSQLPCCKLERICRLHVFLSHGMSPVCEDNDKENAINVCIKENMQDEKYLLNKNLKALAICEKILRTNLVEVKSDTHNFTCTENIITRVLNDEMCEMLKDIASRLHEKDISSC